MKSMYVLAKYRSKYGIILYCCNASDSNIDMNNVYIQTLYYKGNSDIEINKIYSFQTIKGENGLIYCFL